MTRLSCSTKDLFEIVEIMESKGAGIKSLKENWLDTTTPQGKLLFTIFAGLSRFEGDLIAQRTKEGLLEIVVENWGVRINSMTKRKQF